MNITDQLAEALRELVECKKLKDWLPDGLAFENASTTEHRLEYLRRKPLAWSAAFAVLAAYDAQKAEPKKPRFQVGERARISASSIQVEGTIVAAFTTLAGEARYVFEFDNPKGMLHVFNEAQLAPIELLRYETHVKFDDGVRVYKGTFI
jgi:hypothetical protein